MKMKSRTLSLLDFFLVGCLFVGMSFAVPPTTSHGSVQDFLQGIYSCGSNNYSANVVNVKCYGAVGNGVTNDTTAMQNAHNNSACAPVYYPTSQYVFSKITIPCGGIVGDGPAITAGVVGGTGLASNNTDSSNLITYTNSSGIYGGSPIFRDFAVYVTQGQKDMAATVVTGGSGCTNGTQSFTAVGGTSQFPAVFTGTVSGNVLSGALTLAPATLTTLPYHYTVYPTGTVSTTGGGCSVQPTISISGGGAAIKFASTTKSSEATFSNVTVRYVPIGLDMDNADQWTVNNGSSFQFYQVAGIYVANTPNPDQGDSTVTASTFFNSNGGAYASYGAGIFQVSSGGLKVYASKVNGGAFCYLLSVLGQSSITKLTGNSCENVATAGFAFFNTANTGSGPGWQNISILGNDLNRNARAIYFGPIANYLNSEYWDIVNVTGNTIVNNSTNADIEIQTARVVNVVGNTHGLSGTLGLKIDSTVTGGIGSGNFYNSYGTEISNSGTNFITNAGTGSSNPLNAP